MESAKKNNSNFHRLQQDFGEKHKMSKIDDRCISYVFLKKAMWSSSMGVSKVKRKCDVHPELRIAVFIFFRRLL